MVLSENIYKLNQKAKHLKVQVVHNDRNAKKKKKKTQKLTGKNFATMSYHFNSNE